MTTARRLDLVRMGLAAVVAIVIAADRICIGINTAARKAWMTVTMTTEQQKSLHHNDRSALGDNRSSRDHA